MKILLNSVINTEKNEIENPIPKIIEKPRKAKYSNTQKVILTLKALAVFFSEIGLNAKNVTLALCISAFVVVSCLGMWKGIKRALDVEAYAQNQVKLNYKAELNNEIKKDEKLNSSAH